LHALNLLVVPEIISPQTHSSYPAGKLPLKLKTPADFPAGHFSNNLEITLPTGLWQVKIELQNQQGRLSDSDVITINTDLSSRK